MENVFQTDPSLRDPLDLDRPSDGEMVGGNPFLDRLRSNPQFSGKNGLIAEMVDNFIDRKGGSAHGKEHTGNVCICKEELPVL